MNMANLTYYKEEDGVTLYLNEEGYVVDCDGCYFLDWETALLRKTKRLARMIYDMGLSCSILYTGHPRLRIMINGKYVHLIYHEGDPDYILVDDTSRMTQGDFLEELKNESVCSETK